MKAVIFGAALFIGGCIFITGALISPTLSAAESSPILIVGMILGLLGLLFTLIGMKQK